MQQTQGLEQKFIDLLCQKVLPTLGLELYDLQYSPQGHGLRVFIFDPKTQSAVIDDCVKVDHALTPYIESETWMPEKLNLEVSSPGVYRHLRLDWHFEKAIGQNIGLVLRDSLDASYPELPRSLKGNKKIKGTLKTFRPEELEIEINGECYKVERKTIKKANLED